MTLDQDLPGPVGERRPMVQNETQSDSREQWLDLDRPTALQMILLLVLALGLGGAFGLLFS
jgi:hypothetical protein